MMARYTAEPAKNTDGWNVKRNGELIARCYDEFAARSISEAMSACDMLADWSRASGPAYHPECLKDSRLKGAEHAARFAVESVAHAEAE